MARAWNLGLRPLVSSKSWLPTRHGVGRTVLGQLVGPNAPDVDSVSAAAGPCYRVPAGGLPGPSGCATAGGPVVESRTKSSEVAA